MTKFNDLQRKILNEELEITMKITWLDERWVKLLLLNNWHSEIRRYTKLNWEPPKAGVIL
jgi:hypothetical protein